MKFFMPIFFLITLSATPLRDISAKKYLIVWNIGQGQWVTAVENDQCLHFDAGGEFFPWARLRELCGKKQNRFFLSHWDWDHIGALSHSQLLKTLPSSCIALRPLGKSSGRKMNILGSLPDCPDPEVSTWTPGLAKDTNSESHVVSYHHFLMPGDSPIPQERKWEWQPWVPTTEVLVLGHHGSRTSTSLGLLRRMPHLKMAVSSARWARYHHPHAEVVALLKRFGISLLRTEDFGNLWFEL